METTARRLRVEVVFEYDVIPEHYPVDRRTASAMAKFDVEQDVATLLEGNNFHVAANYIG